MFVHNDDFNDFLKENSLKLITKSRVKRESKSNIIIIEGCLPQEEYNYLFLHSSCNILFYTRDFKYRSSGVLNECFANKIPCIFSDCPALKAYLQYINNDQCVFKDVEGLKESIRSSLVIDRDDYYKGLDEIQNPLIAWKEVLEG